MNDRLDNYFKDCPGMMDDGRMFTDYRSSQVREELFRHKHCVNSENEARTLRIDYAEDMLDTEWQRSIRDKSCWPRKQCFHHHPTVRVTTEYNNAETLAYNGALPTPRCSTRCHDYRMTVTPGSRKGRNNCSTDLVTHTGYPSSRYPKRCAKTKRHLPERLYTLPDEL